MKRKSLSTSSNTHPPLQVQPDLEASSILIALTTPDYNPQQLSSEVGLTRSTNPKPMPVPLYATMSRKQKQFLAKISRRPRREAQKTCRATSAKSILWPIQTIETDKVKREEKTLCHCLAPDPPLMTWYTAGFGVCTLHNTNLTKKTKFKHMDPAKWTQTGAMHPRVGFFNLITFFLHL